MFEAWELIGSEVMSDLEDQTAETEPRAEAGVVVMLLAGDIPGAELAEPLDKHPVTALRWWLLCRGIKVSTSVRKKDLIDRLVMAMCCIH